MKSSILRTVEKLHSLELFEDLIFYNELVLSENRIADSLKIDEQLFVCFCIGNAYFEILDYSHSERWYDNALRILQTIKRQSVTNHFDEMVNIAEVRFRLHRVLVKNRKMEEALKCLEAIPKSDLTPKIQHAIMKLNMRSRKVNKPSYPLSAKIVNSLRSIVEQVPEAILCKSILALSGIDTNGEQFIGAESSDETAAWFAAKKAEQERNFPLAISCLNKFMLADNFRLISESAHYHRIIGDKRKAMDLYEKAHLMDRSLPYGMDAYAALLFQAKKLKELEMLAEYLVNSNPRSSETYVVFSYLSRLQRRPRDSIMPLVQRAVNSAVSGRQKAEALFLRGVMHLETKRHKECEGFLREALLYDNTHADVYDTQIRSLMCQKRTSEARALAKSALEFLGENNQRAQFFMALAIAEDICDAPNAIERLEMVVEKSPFITDAIYLLTCLYEKHQLYDKGMKLVKNFTEIQPDTNARRILREFSVKFRPQEFSSTPLAMTTSVLTEQRSRLGGNPVDMVTSDIITPPSSSGSSVFGCRAPPQAPIAPVRMRRTTQPYHLRRTAVTSGIPTVEINPCELTRISPPNFDESIDMMDEWYSTRTPIEANNSLQSTASSNSSNSSRLAAVITSSGGLATRSTRRHNLTSMLTSSAARVDGVEMSSASGETVAERDQRLRRSRNLNTVREQSGGEFLRNVHHNHEWLRQHRQTRNTQQLQQSASSSSSTLELSIQHPIEGGTVTPPNNRLNSFRSDSFDDESRIDGDVGLEEEEGEEIDDVGDANAEFFMDMQEESSSMHTLDNAEGSFAFNDTNDVDIVDDDDIDDFPDRALM